ncbi:hypothetical protein [uncultured Novosphingobium sp.]|uniref:hypothetical protein n=1 Tax=uncultured Novosphingobium sp. TaxID=292277 RepID=UPI0037496754
MSARFGNEGRALNAPHQVLQLDFWLTVSRGPAPGRRPTVRVSAGYPALGRDERAINLKLELPIALFETPSLSASIVVDQPVQAAHIDVSTIADAVRQAIGMDIDISVSVPEGSRR